MVRKLPGAVVLVAWASVVVAAADFWESKPFMTWSVEEVQKVLSDSPWSRNVNIVIQTVGRGAPLGENEGSRGGGSGGGGGGNREGGGGGGAGGRGGGGAFPTAPPQLKLTLSWRSALPMKQALVRDQIGPGGAIPAEGQELLSRTESMYVITIMGLPTRYAQTINGMKAGSFLKRNNKPPIALADIAVQQAPASEKAPAFLMVVFIPRTDAIKLEDKDVEFVTKLGEIDIKKKFNLKDMSFTDIGTAGVVSHVHTDTGTRQTNRRVVNLHSSTPRSLPVRVSGSPAAAPAARRPADRPARCEDDIVDDRRTRRRYAAGSIESGRRPRPPLASRTITTRSATPTRLVANATTRPAGCPPDRQRPIPRS